MASLLLGVSKKGAVCFWNVDSQVIEGSKTLTPFAQAIDFVSEGWTLNDVIIWRKTNPMPQVRQPRYRHVFEYCFVFCKGSKPKTFHPIMEPCKSAGLVYSSTSKQIDLTRKKKVFSINSEQPISDVWNIAVAQNKTGHPAVFPLELPRRAILTWTNEGDCVLDPYCGSGTTCLASKLLGRDCVGYEIDAGYTTMARKRIESDEQFELGGNDPDKTGYDQIKLF